MIRPEDIACGPGVLAPVQREQLVPLPAPLNGAPPPSRKIGAVDCSLDGFNALGMPTAAWLDEETMVRAFVSGIQKLLNADDNWTFLQQLTLSLDHCARCDSCAEACPIYHESGRNPAYRPAYRSEVFRRLLRKYGKRGGKWTARLRAEDIELNATAIARLAELSYRCTMCRRCAQACPMGVDNALLTRELRKLFSMEMGIAAKELHESGSMLQLRVGSSTGMNPRAAKNNVEFLDEEASEAAGLTIHTPWDKEGADVLLIHNAGEILSWPENPMAFAVILEAAGISWTLSGDLAAYDSVNYGVWYDDVQFARVAVKQAEAARKLKVKKIVLGECGHGHKASMVVADRVLTGDLNVPRESALVLLRDIVRSGRLKVDASRNDFPVTLHDPCNMVRLMGIVEPQREILRAICPQFREMTPHGVDNYCCGGGSGFAIMSGQNFMDWRMSVAGRRKVRQIVEAFVDQPSPEVKKYVCAPCSNCKGQLRDLFQYHGLWEKCGITYGGLAELIVNAMPGVKPGFLRWDSH
jgi:Fe-S oxidoreductase